ncbi:MAG TPA: TIGR04282 family arsenosugar biosynthesis glycosyltransferase [Alphaproteobacteria bacterium]|nr:TIGR04282 family arsenosugar biosynthesis glycosyltransferase [Alphaproteobacteria bacterium]
MPLEKTRNNGETGADPQHFCAIAVMAKAPQRGKVKTRLVPPLTPDGAMRLSMSFLRDITENIQLAARSVPIQGFIAYAPAGAEALFRGTVASGTEFVLADGSPEMSPRVGGLGRSLLHASRGLFAKGYRAACLVNSDSPTLPTAYLREAAEALSTPGERIVLGPADDGGYYLIGMKAPDARLFEDIRWSTQHVAAETAARAKTLGLDVVMLPSWYDVDDRPSLRRLLRDLSADTAKRTDGHAPYSAPATAEAIAQIGLGENSDFAEDTPSPGASAEDLAS